MTIMDRIVVFVVCSLAISVGAAPFVNLKLGGENGIGSGAIFSKVKNIGEQVLETKRNILIGINEKVSGLLWIPPLPSATTAAAHFEEFYPTERLNYHPTPNTHEQLIFATDENAESYEEPYLAIYARSSFLSPDDLIVERPVSPTEKPKVTVNVGNYFNLFGKSG